MFEYLMKGFLLGLSLSGTCLATCGPIYAPYMLMGKRSFKENMKIAFMISVGRFITYGLFGLAAGILGQTLSADFREYATGISFVILSIFLYFYTFKPALKNHKTCTTKKFAGIANGSPLMLGLITGISFCPSFLIALTSAFEKAGAVSGLLFFTAFFFGTTIIILPISFLGFLPHVNFLNIKKIGKAASAVVIVWFLFSGITTLYKKVEPKFSPVKSVNFLKSETITILSTKEESLYAQSLKQNLLLQNTKNISIVEESDIVSYFKNAKQNSYILVTANSITSQSIKNEIVQISKFRKLYCLEIDSPSLNTPNPSQDVIKKLDFFNFTVKNKGFLFTIVTKKL